MGALWRVGAMNIEWGIHPLCVLLMAARLHSGEEADALHLRGAAHLAFTGDRCRTVGSYVDGSLTISCYGASLKLEIGGAGAIGFEGSDELDRDRAHAGIVLWRDLNYD